MNVARQERKAHWESLNRTTSGREQIIEAYRRSMVDRAYNILFCAPYNQMIEAILDAELRQEFELRRA